MAVRIVGAKLPTDKTLNAHWWVRCGGKTRGKELIRAELLIRHRVPSHHCLSTLFNLCLTSYFKLLYAVTTPSLDTNSQKSNWLYTTEKGHRKGCRATTKKEIQQNVLLTVQAIQKQTVWSWSKQMQQSWDCTPGERGRPGNHSYSWATAEQNYGANRHASPYQWFHSASCNKNSFLPKCHILICHKQLSCQQLTKGQQRAAAHLLPLIRSSHHSKHSESKSRGKNKIPLCPQFTRK